MTNKIIKHVYPVVNLLIENTVKNCEDENEPIRCAMGCSHCCYLFVEVSWEEASNLAEWILKQKPKLREDFITRINENADKAKAFFAKYKRFQVWQNPIDDAEVEVPNSLCDYYFTKLRQPCPLLNLTTGACQAYEERPVSCRLHMVTSDPNLCRYDVGDPNDEYCVPDYVEELKSEVAPINSALAESGRWGHLGIMVQAALRAQTR